MKKNEQLSEHLDELSQTARMLVANPLKPLRAFRSLKMKIGILVLGSVGTTVLLYWLGIQFGLVWPSISGILAAVGALILARFFAGGLTSPLKEMAAVSKRLSIGDYSKRVHSTSQDEIGALAQTFNAMAQELSKTEQLRKELIANASHELKTPLTALQAQLENIADGIEEPTHEKITSLLAQTEHLSALVKQLLDLSRLESGMIEFENKPVKLNDAIQTARDLVSSNFPEITYSIESRDVSVEGDYHRLVQVFTNLMSNAARHVGVQGMVRCSMHPKAGMIAVYIDDDGPGIDPNLRPLIFERFFRADTARNSKDGGAGIGLAISKQIVLMHGGTISATTSDLGGARIEVCFPIHNISKRKIVKDSLDPKSKVRRNRIQNKEISKWNSIPSAT